MNASTPRIAEEIPAMKSRLRLAVLWMVLTGAAPLLLAPEASAQGAQGDCARYRFELSSSKTETQLDIGSRYSAAETEAGNLTWKVSTTGSEIHFSPGGELLFTALVPWRWDEERSPALVTGSAQVKVEAEAVKALGALADSDPLAPFRSFTSVLTCLMQDERMGKLVSHGASGPPDAACQERCREVGREVQPRLNYLLASTCVHAGATQEACSETAPPMSRAAGVFFATGCSWLHCLHRGPIGEAAATP